MTKNTIFIGDCRKVLINLPPRSIDVVITSPPYNIGTKYSKHSDDMTDAEYCDFIFQAMQAVWRVLKPGGSVFLNIAGSNSKPQLPFRLVQMLLSIYKLQNTIHWIKSISVGSRTHGHFKPINSKRFLHNGHEYIFHLTKQGDVALNRLAVGVPYVDKTNIARRGHAQDKRCRGNVWFIPYRTVQNKSGKFKHPSIFPVQLPRFCIKLHGRSDELIVLDPFMGSGTTLVAANKERAKRAIGVELDKQYVQTAKHRLRSYGSKVKRYHESAKQVINLKS